MHVGENLRRTFTEWLLHSSRPERIPAPRADGQAPASGTTPEAHGWAVDALLYQLWDSTDTLPQAASKQLQLPRSATFGHAAQLLWWLRTGDRFACSSYAQAVEGVGKLDGPTFAELYGRISDYLADSDRARETAEGASRPLLAS